MLVYFSHLITYRCAIEEVRYGYNGGAVDQVYKLPCNILDPNSVPEDAKIYMKVPPKTNRCRFSLPTSTARNLRCAVSTPRTKRLSSSILSRWIAAVGTQCPSLG